ncbi:MAG: PilZ domain-containing protein [Oligoflexales bacterium]
MSEQVWYIYQQSQQQGPFDHPKIMQMLGTNMISQDAYLFKVGWKDWLPLEDCHGQLGTTPSGNADTIVREARAPRATIKGRIIVHNNGQLVIGAGVNISSSGMFVETPDPIFEVGETLKVTCRIDGFLQAFNASAQVMRFNQDRKFPVGYGLKFVALDKKVESEIQGLIDQSNQILQESAL